MVGALYVQQYKPQYLQLLAGRVSLPNTKRNNDNNLQNNVKGLLEFICYLGQ